MNAMWKYIPPLASDYSGVCSIVFAMDSLNILYSPGGCSHPIVEVDETRNFFDTYLFATKWNDVDVVQGNEKLINDLKEMDLSRFHFISLIGTPIPDLTGVNLKSCAQKIEKELKKPVVLFETNGFESYPIGIANGFLKLAEKFIDPSERESPEKQINVLGYNPFVWGEDRHLNNLLDYFSGSSLRFNILGCKRAGFQNMTISSKARLNLVLAEEGVKLAEELKEKYKIPYIVKLPVGITEMSHYLSMLEEELDICLPGKNQIELERGKLEIRRDVINKKVLIIGEPFVSVALKKCLENDFGIEKVSMVSLIKKDTKSEALFPQARYAEVHFIKSQGEIMESADCAEIIIADPIFKKMLSEKQNKTFIPLPYFGLSGREFAHIDYDYIGINGFKYLKKYLNK